MTAPGDLKKPGYLRAILWGLLVVVFCLGLFVAWMRYADWSLKREVHEFCDGIPIGSDIAAATARSKGYPGLGWSTDRGYNKPLLSAGDYTFVFPAGFDGFFCTVAVDRRGKVISRKAEFYYD